MTVANDSEASGGNDWARALALGAGAGVAATVVMTGAMYAFQRLGLLGRMPPQRIVDHALASFGVFHGTRRGARRWAAAAAHLGFGATQGAMYGAGTTAYGALRGAAPAPKPHSAIPFALAVWATSYAGWIPKLGIMPPPSRDRSGRPTSMIVAHIIYGAVLGALLRRTLR